MKLPFGEVDVGDLAGDRASRRQGHRRSTSGELRGRGRSSAILSSDGGSSSRPRSIWSSRSDPTSTPTFTSSPKESSPISSPISPPTASRRPAPWGIREGQEQIVARLEPTSKVRRRETAKLWADTAKLHLFDPESGESLKARAHD